MPRHASCMIGLIRIGKDAIQNYVFVSNQIKVTYIIELEVMLIELTTDIRSIST